MGNTPVIEESVFQSRLQASAEEVYRWHARPGALERLTPPWERVHILEHTGGLTDGSRVTLETRIGPFHNRWVAEHYDCVPGDHFCDRQVTGPFALWDHQHYFRADGSQHCLLEDHIRFRLPGGALGRALGHGFIQKRLKRFFEYRHTITAGDLAKHATYEARPRRRIAVTGASGLIGRSLLPFLTTGGHEAVPVVRRAGVPEAIFWNPAAGELQKDKLAECDAVIHLAGDNIGQGRWTEKKKAVILTSRHQGTALLARTLAQMPRGPRTLICASAVGYYGNRGDTMLEETSSGGDGFLAEVVDTWENATRPAIEAGLRVVFVRFGIVLTPAGGALAKMLPIFQAGLGGTIGSGRQYWSWLGMEDALGILHYALMEEGLAGPINAVAPHSVTNREFASTLARVLHRPALLPVPAGVLRIVLGEMAEETMLSSTRVAPTALLESGYAFHHPDLAGALEFLLGKSV